MKRTFAAKSNVTVPAGEFKSRCLALLDEVNDEQKRLVITKRGKPCADVVPHRAETVPFRSVVGRTPNLEIIGDVISPAWETWSETEWEWH